MSKEKIQEVSADRPHHPHIEKKKFKLSHIPAHILLIILVFVNLFPLYWMLTFSLKGQREIEGYREPMKETRWEQAKGAIVNVLGDASTLQWESLQTAVTDSIQANLNPVYRNRGGDLADKTKARLDYTAELQQLVDNHWEEILAQLQGIEGILSEDLLDKPATDPARAPIRTAAEKIVNDFLRESLYPGLAADDSAEAAEGGEETYAIPGDGGTRLAFTFSFSNNKWQRFCGATDQIVKIQKYGVEDPWDIVKDAIAVVMGDQTVNQDGKELYTRLDKPDDIYYPPNTVGLPHELAFENYPNAFTGGTEDKGYMGKLFLNSIFVTVVTIVITIVAAFMATYAITRLVWKGRKMMNKFFMLGLTIPIHAALVPVYIIMSRIGMLSTLWALILPYSAFSLAMGILISIGFMGDIPYDLDEAAFLDGCGVWGIFFRVIIPLMMPAISTIGIYTFLQCWNELLLATVYINENSMFTLPVGINTWASSQTKAADWGKIGAGLVIATAPTLIIYIALSKKIQAGFIAGAVKG